MFFRFADFQLLSEDKELSWYQLVPVRCIRLSVLACATPIVT